MTNKENAIQLLDGYKPRAYGGGVRTASLEQVATQKTTEDMATRAQLRRWRRQSSQSAPAPNYWIVGGIVVGVVATAIVLIRYKIIQL